MIKNSDINIDNHTPSATAGKLLVINTGLLISFSTLPLSQFLSKIKTNGKFNYIPSLQKCSSSWISLVHYYIAVFLTDNMFEEQHTKIKMILLCCPLIPTRCLLLLINCALYILQTQVQVGWDNFACHVSICTWWPRYRFPLALPHREIYRSMVHQLEVVASWKNKKYYLCLFQSQIIMQRPHDILPNFK